MYAIAEGKVIPVSGAIAAALGATFDTEEQARTAENIEEVIAFDMTFGIPAPAGKPKVKKNSKPEVVAAIPSTTPTLTATGDNKENINKAIKALKKIELPPGATVYIVGKYLWIDTKQSNSFSKALRSLNMPKYHRWQWNSTRKRYMNPCGCRSKGKAKGYKPWQKYGQKKVSVKDE